MAKSKFKLTGFARFVMFLLIAGPVFFFGVTFLKGEDPMTLLKETIGLVEPAKKAEALPPPPPPVEAKERAKEEGKTAVKTDPTQVNAQVKKLKDDLEYKDERISDLYEENEKLRTELKSLKKGSETIEKLKKQLEKKDEQMKTLQAELNKIKEIINGK